MMPFPPIIGSTEIASSGYMTIQPTSGQYYNINNLWSNQSFDLYISDSTTDVLMDTNSSGDYLSLQKHIINNTRYLKLKNTSTNLAVMGYSGIRIY